MNVTDEARHHAISLRQMAIFGADAGQYVAKSMTDAADFLDALAAAPASAAEPRMWFVKDFADGWIAFDNEADAKRQVDATGAMMLLGYQFPLYADPVTSDT